MEASLVEVSMTTYRQVQDHVRRPAARRQIADLEKQFHKQMLGVYRAALVRCNYRAIRFLQMVHERGGVQAARDLLHTEHYPEGLTALWECNCLDISMEALIRKDPWRQLFTDQELAVAEKRLKDLGYLA
jgi:hypothetical protein